MTKNNLKIVKTDDKKQKELKEKSKSLEAAISQIDQNFGKGSVMRLGQQQALDVEAISTGSLSLDLALGIGGLPKGRIIEIYGPESSGKTTLALQVVPEAQKDGGISALVDAGAGTAAHRSADNAPCVTISLDLKFIGSSKVGDEIIGHVKILKKTKTLVFLFCELKCNDKIITSASGVWKILKNKS